MSVPNFMLADWLGVLAGFALFSLIAFFPGYAIGWLLDLVRFRTRTFPFRLALSVPLSIAFGPLLCYLIGFWSLNAVWAVFAILSAIACAIAVRERQAFFSRTQLVPMLLVICWLAISFLLLTDLQLGHRLYYPITGFDYAVRTAFINSINTFGLPARSPFFFPGHPVLLRYHYYWLIECALVEQLGGRLVDARQALIAGAMWCGIGIISLVPLYLRLFTAKAEQGIVRRSVIGISLMGITGLDILPLLAMLALYAKGIIQDVFPSVEMWNEQIDGWICTMLWEPHYVASLIACLTGFLILWDAAGRRLLVPGIAAGLAFATAVGSGVYVAFVFAVFLAAWTVVTLIKKWYRETMALALAGVVAAVASIPFLRNLRAPGAAGPFLQLTVRMFSLTDFLLPYFSLDQPWQHNLANLIFLPLNYLLELGFFFAVGLLAWSAFRHRRKTATRLQLAGFTMLATSIAICTFLRSGVIYSNDLGWRGFLIAQFILLIWAVDILANTSRGDRAILTVLIALGAAGVVYDLASLKFFPVLMDAGRAPKLFWMSPDQKLGERTYANRAAYEWLRASTAPGAIVQQNPDPPFQDTLYGLYANRQTVAENSTCGTAFGGKTTECDTVVKSLKKLYSDANSHDFDNVCAALPIDVFVARDIDEVWKYPDSWVWTRQPMYSNSLVRLFPRH